MAKKVKEGIMGIPTPHIEVKEQGVIAKTVLMPGDPLRAKFIAENFLEDPVLFNTVRNMFGYTGTYKGKKVTVMGSGMGMASIGIYSYELFSFYDVERIIRIGSAGSYTHDLKLYDVVLVDEAYSESTFARVLDGYDKDTIQADKELNDKIMEIAEEKGIPVHRGIIHSSDVFYRKNFKEFEQIRDEKGAIGVEMESFALFANARFLNKKATCILTVSDSLVSGEVTDAKERQTAFTKMMELALELA